MVLVLLCNRPSFHRPSHRGLLVPPAYLLLRTHMPYVRQIRRGPFARLPSASKAFASEKFNQSACNQGSDCVHWLINRTPKSKSNIKLKNKLNNSIMVKIIVVGGVAGGASAAARLRRLNGTSVICDMCFLVATLDECRQ